MGDHGWKSLDMLLSRKVISEEEEISLKVTFAQPFNESLTAPSAATLPGPAEGPLLTPVSLAILPLDGQGLSVGYG